MTVISAPNLHIFMGAGGVGKTTVSAAFSLALAKQGAKVALFSIDPARRLQDALGVKSLTEEGVVLPLPENFKGSCLASTIHVRETINRWVTESAMSYERREKLFLHPMYNSLCDKFATSTDTFAGARVAEWLQSGKFTDIVIDTAPGLHALDFMRKPDRISEFFDGKLVEWLKLFFGQEANNLSFVQKIVKNGAKKLLDGMAKIGGEKMVSSLADFFILLESVFAKMVERVKYTSAHFRTAKTKFYVVSSVRDDALAVAVTLKSDLAALKFNRSLFVLNRCLPQSFFADCAHLKSNQLSAYFDSLEKLQINVCEELLRQGNDCVTLPWLAQSETEDVVESLNYLGEQMLSSSQGLV